MTSGKKYKIVIIGSGFGGQIAAINLLKRKITDFRIIERRNFMGGTWVQNTYPGAAVDVPSPLYSLSFEPYKWSKMFAGQDELKEYTNYIIDKHNLREKTDTNTNVKGMHWNQEDKYWTVETNTYPYKADIIINASGPLSTPVIPNFKGKDSFKGKSFHTNDWDHSYDYKNKKVAVIGVGASAAQVIPSIVNDVEELSVFQRSPHWVIPRPDIDFNDKMRNLLGVNFIYKTLRTAIYWQLESRVIGFKYSEFLLKVLGQKDAERFLEKEIKDPELRKKLTPDFTMGCKRVIISSTLYPALSQKHVTLFDKTQGIKEILSDGILTEDGQKVDLDLIIYSTGYDATDGMISYPVVGKNNMSLSQFWEDFPRAYLGTVIPGFPNLFIVTGPNTGIGHTSAIFIIEAQVEYIMKAIKTLEKSNSKAIEVTECAEEEYTTFIHEEMKKTVWLKGGCNSWYKSRSGKVVAMFPGFSFTYRRMTNKIDLNHHILS